MLSSLVSSLLTLFLSIHAQLYAPIFVTFPQANATIQQQTDVTLTSPTFAYTEKPVIDSEAAIVIEQHSAEVVYAKNEHRRLFPASTTKIMTALLTIEELDLSSVASVSGTLAQDGSRMGLMLGEQIRVSDLLTGLLIKSANDAADELSRIYPGGQEAFIARMNQRAFELGLVDTHYTNPIGYSDPGHVTSVRDLAILTREAMKHEEFASRVQVRERVVTNTDKTIAHYLKTTNELLGSYPGIQGVKTGWTEEAGECFVAQATRDHQTFTSVVLKSPDRFGETKKLLDWAFVSFKTETRPLSAW